MMIELGLIQSEINHHHYSACNVTRAGGMLLKQDLKVTPELHQLLGNKKALAVLSAKALIFLAYSWSRR